MHTDRVGSTCPYCIPIPPVMAYSRSPWGDSLWINRLFGKRLCTGEVVWISVNFIAYTGAMCRQVGPCGWRLASLGRFTVRVRSIKGTHWQVNGCYLFQPLASFVHRVRHPNGNVP